MYRIQKTLALVFLTAVTAFAQKHYDVAEIEAKSRKKMITFRANGNTSNYDVTYHKLELEIDPGNPQMRGEVTTIFTALEDMQKVVFDLNDNMKVTSVTQNGKSLNFSQNYHNELVIGLSKSLYKGSSATVVIEYQGDPTVGNYDGSYVRSKTGIGGYSGTPIVWTLSEPYGAKDWWPCKQDLTDKIESIDIYVKTPENYTVAANGLEQSSITLSGYKTTHFKHNYPIPAYLVAVAVTEYAVYNHTVENNGKPFEIVNYVYPEDESLARRQTAVTVDIMNVYSELFGEYPFAKEKYGHAQCGMGGGMEHTTVSFMGDFDRGLIAHELGHQWFGDYITCGSWKDIWLNEGLTSYLEGITIEHLDGDEEFTEWRKYRTGVITSEKGGNLYLKDQDTTSIDRIFSSRITYKKGSMVVHMLRKKLGDEKFFKAVKSYLRDSKLAYGYAKTVDFKKHLETESGMDLTEFFNDWVYNEGYPMYSLTWEQTSPDKIDVVLNQEQSHYSVSFFEAGVPIRLKGYGGEILDVVLDNTHDGQLFSVEVPFKIHNVQIDPETDLITRRNSSALSTESQSMLGTSVSLYPNPVRNILTVKVSSDLIIETVTVFNTLGQKMAVLKTDKIDLTKYASGIYLLDIKTNKGSLKKTIIKR